MARSRVAILRKRQFDEELQTETLSVWGYRAECDCGWKGERRQVISTARRDLKAHLDWWHRTLGKGDDG